MGDFFNGYVKDLQTLITLSVSAVIILAIFSVIYNRWMTDLGEKKDGYTAILVAIGNAFTLLVVAFISWKAALIVLVAFIADGTAMIAGDIKRASSRREKLIQEAKKTPRRKPLPYYAARLIADAIDDLIAAERKAEQSIETENANELPNIARLISKALRYLVEAKAIEGE